MKPCYVTERKAFWFRVVIDARLLCGQMEHELAVHQTHLAESVRVPQRRLLRKTDRRQVGQRMLRVDDVALYEKLKDAAGTINKDRTVIVRVTMHMMQQQYIHFIGEPMLFVLLVNQL